MTQLVAAELLKLRTTRAWLAYVPAVLLFSGATAAAEVASAEEFELGTAELSRTAIESALVAGFVAFLVGIVAVTAEWRHGTVTRTFLVTPKRERVLLAKLAAGVVVALVLTLVALVSVLVVASIWTAAEGASFALDDSVASRIGRTLLAGVLWATFGVSVGALVQSQTAALVFALVWLLLGEALARVLLELVDLGRVGDFLPGAALSSFEGSSNALSPAAGAAVSLGWIVAFAVLGGYRMARRDVT